MAAEVRGRWKRVRLGEVTRESGARNEGRIPDDEVHGVLKSDGLVPMRERVKGSGLTDRYKVVSPAAFAYNPMRLNIGSIAHSDLTRPVLVSPDYVVFECATDLLDHAYLNHVRRSREWESFAGSGGSGSVRTRIYFRDLAEFTLLLPPLPEQHRIAEILTSVDEAIQTTEAVIEQTKRVKQGLLARLLTRGIGHTRFKATEVGRIPQGWEVQSLGTLLSGIDAGWSPECESSPPASGEWGVLKVSSVTRGEFLENESKALPGSLMPRTDLLVRKGDLLVARANGVAELVGRAAVVRSDPTARLMLSDKTLRLVPKRALLQPEFLAYFLETPLCREQIKLLWGGSSGQKNISQAQLRGLKMSVPPIREQVKIAEALDAVDDSRRQELANLEALQTLKRGLLSDLLSGRVRVKVPRV